MNELDRTMDALRPGAGVPVLATLMSVAGSAYRGPGARMVVRPDDTTVGAISGGCLEKDVVAHAGRVRARGAAETVGYDLTGGDDAPWGLNMGCNAKLDVLLEPCPAGPPAYLAAARDALRAREAVVLSTLFAVRGAAAGVPIAARALTIGDRPGEGPLAAGPLGAAITAGAARARAAARSAVATYPVGGGEAMVLHEYLAVPVRLVICGESGDTTPLRTLGEALGWTVVGVGKADALPAMDARTAAVVMTHHYPRDVALIGTLLPSPAGYVGLLGPRSRTERVLADVRAAGVRPHAAALARLHAPIGLDIGAETPEEIALAVAAEVRAQMAARPGGKLRERDGGIHDRR